MVANVRYLPFGEERWNEVDMPTDRGYTGQRNEQSFGLMDYNARFYSPILGRFISPDSIVQDPADAKLFDRYAYVGNNPIMHNDPSGHCFGPLVVLCAAAVPVIMLLAPQISMVAIDQGNMISSWNPDPNNPIDTAFQSINTLLVAKGVVDLGVGVTNLLSKPPAQLSQGVAVTGKPSRIGYVGFPEGAPADAGVISEQADAWVQGVGTNRRLVTPEQAQQLASSQSQSEFEGLLGDGWTSSEVNRGKGTSYKQGNEEVRLMQKPDVSQSCYVFRWSTCVSQNEAVASGLKIHEPSSIPGVFVNAEDSGWIQHIPNGGGYALNWSLDGDLSWVAPKDLLINHVITGIQIQR